MTAVYTNQSGTPKLWTTTFFWGWAIFTIIYFALCFQPGILRSDDFGYSRSVLGTLARGKLYTYEWLEPFGAFYSFACAFIYRLSGNFYLATNGFQALCVLLFFPLLYTLIAKRFSGSNKTWITLLMTTSPLFLVKESDFHACICTLDLLLLSLIIFETGKLTWFFPIALLAFSNRQNHVCLLILPLWNMFEKFYRERKVEWSLVVGIFAYITAAVGLFTIMNRTYSTINHPILKSSFGATLLSSIPALMTGIFVTLAIFSLVSCIPNFSGDGNYGKKKYWLIRIALSLCLLGFMPFWPETMIKTDTPFFGLWGWVEFNHTLPWVILPLILGLDFRFLKLSPYLALISGYILVASLRSTWWDYYFMEIIIISIILICPEKPKINENIKVNLTKGLLLIFLLAANIAYGYLLKVQSDKQRLSVFVMEKLERAGKITVDQMSGATFGYLGWKLFDFYISHEGKVFKEGIDFMGYVNPNRVMIETHLPWRNSYKTVLSMASKVLDSGECKIGFVKVKYRVVDLNFMKLKLGATDSPLVLDLGQFQSPVFPLTNLEWRNFINGSKK